MRALLLAVALPVLLLAAAPAFAQCDCSSTGLYFDPGAGINCTGADAAGSGFDLYFVYAFPLFEQVHGFRAGITVEGGGLQLTAGESPFGAGPGTLDLADLHYESATPVPLQDFTVLLRLRYDVVEPPDTPVRFYLHSAASTKAAYDRPRLLLGGGEYYETPVWEIEPDTGLAAVLAPSGEGCTALPSEPASWDRVKALYR